MLLMYHLDTRMLDPLLQNIKIVFVIDIKGCRLILIAIEKSQQTAECVVLA